MKSLVYCIQEILWKLCYFLKHNFLKVMLFILKNINTDHHLYSE